MGCHGPLPVPFPDRGLYLRVFVLFRALEVNIQRVPVLFRALKQREINANINSNSKSNSNSLIEKNIAKCWN